MNLTQRPFRNLGKSKKDEYLDKALYHGHRATEFLHKYQEEVKNEEARNHSCVTDPNV